MPIFDRKKNRKLSSNILVTNQTRCLVLKKINYTNFMYLKFFRNQMDLHNSALMPVMAVWHI